MGLAVPYRQRHPERTAFYQCLEDYWEEFKESYRYFYERDYGSLRPVVDKTVDRFSECGMFRHGFARIRCRECRKEYLLAFSCKTRYFCVLQSQLTMWSSKPSWRSRVCGPTVGGTPCTRRGNLRADGWRGSVSYDIPHRNRKGIAWRRAIKWN